MASSTSGNCYLCGSELKKVGMKNHIMKKHLGEGDQKCWLLKIEGKHDKNYWLYIDVPVDKTLASIDKFLRDIWLECCGHLSAFSVGREEIGKSRKLSYFHTGDKLVHEYDFGSTTTTLITFVDKIKRPAQRKNVRLLARNVPMEATCKECGEPAEYIESSWWDAPSYCCEECAENHDDEKIIMQIVNSPRMGVCGYDYDDPEYVFDAEKFKK